MLRFPLRRGWPGRIFLAPLCPRQPYVELTGDAPFSEDAVIVHATQYFGKRKKPRGAVIQRALFRTVE